MITIRGITVRIQPLGLDEIAAAGESIDIIGAAGANALQPAVIPHVVKVITLAVRRQIPDAREDEVKAALNVTNIGSVLLALVGRKLPPRLSHAFKEQSHGQLH